VPRQDIKTVMGRDPSAVIPFDPKVFMGAEAEGKKIPDMKGGEEMVQALLPLAEKVVKRAGSKIESEEKSSKEKGLFDQVLNKLKSR
jgi:Flp pilus assembly CpaE family ATPase